ncbi:hypothetical protein CBR_g50226 [Chara braunii]|uniref:Uncharacterized protein n=1 Tax=Chara braunii TaxID=69332 RepID=A0A388M6N2_CHABU|nr:hypothetical protein CBR_g50226 [Chara braunii]|eukprot:GBG90132.1 hypothetical protein CBR_g50226 [Chara braunii]
MDGFRRAQLHTLAVGIHQRAVGRSVERSVSRLGETYKADGEARRWRRIKKSYKTSSCVHSQQTGRSLNRRTRKSSLHT